MSLFPAYSTEASSVDANKKPNTEWLTNSSFQIDVTGSVPERAPKTHKRKSSSKKRHKEVKKHKVEKEPEQFFIDTKKNKEFLTLNRLERSSRPEYKIRFYLNASNGKKLRKKPKIKRYFKHSWKIENEPDEPNLTKSDLNKPPEIERNDLFPGFAQEHEMAQSTANFNRQLAINPNDIDLWLKYIQFQDTVFQHEKTYKKGSIAKGQRVTAERKLSIVDKALMSNSGCERLLRERLNISVSVYPSDELQMQLSKLVDKDQGNIILWQGFIESTQCSMSHCNTPAVLKLYNRCLSTLHQLRRTASVEKSLLEEYILRMLYQCGLFLKQSGLFEQLWTLLRLYLELNLSPIDKNQFNIPSGFDEKQLMDLEDVVLNSQLPIHELWLRIEKLREGCHWLPCMEENADPQRLVFPEDVAELIHPITMPGNTFRLTATILSLLKAPLLYSRHTTLQNLGLDYVPWAFDSVESLLPLYLPSYPIDLTNRYLLKDMHKLAIGPQYLKVFPGQEEYLHFLFKTMKNCIDCLAGREKQAVTVWWLKFYRLLIVLDKQERFKMSSTFKKQMKVNVKNLLKGEESTLVYYQEYALIEYELGNKENAFKVLDTAIKMNLRMRKVSTINNEEEKANLCSLFRCIIELHLNTEKDKALNYLILLSTGKDAQESCAEATLAFKHTTMQLLGKEQMILPTTDHFLPDFFTDWIICHGWFIYLTKSPLDSGAFIDETLSDLDGKCGDISWRKEVLYEFYTAIMFKNCMENSCTFQLLDDVLHRSLALYPNNLFLLSVLAKEQSLNCTLGQPWWKTSELLMKSGRALPVLFLILIANQRICQIEENWTDTVTGRMFSLDSSHVNRTISLFKKVTAHEMCTRRCGLVWRLYLQFLQANFDLSFCRKAYYVAVEECPWLKALYIDAAIYIPAELPQIQDLLLEKQLRLHVTPEELEILRN